MWVKDKNIVLIGMPSAGKSTIGQILAARLQMAFTDTDTVIKEREKKELKDIVNSQGHEVFLQIQEKAILGLDLTNHVIATGGSVVYGEASMRHLKANSLVVYLEVEFEEVEQRVAVGRRFARRKEQSLLELYNERVPLYKKYADITVNSTGKNVEEVVNKVLKHMTL